MSRVLAIGIDGGTFDIIRPGAAAGHLPHFARLLGQGASGTLKSTIPPLTGPAWSSFQTGRNPGQHGVFDWLYRDPISYGLKPVSARRIGHPTLWDLIGKQGGTCGVVNVPVTYPPRPVNGFLVTGLLTPTRAKTYTHPDELASELRAVAPSYSFVPRVPFDKKHSQPWIGSCMEMVEQRCLAATHLMTTRPWDFFMVHFTATDVIQHRMWHTVANAPDENPVLQIYRTVDEALGRLLDACPADTTVILMSDHGFGPLREHIYLNNWLLRNGYLQLRRDPSTRLRKLLFSLGLTPANAYRVLGALGVLGRSLKLGKGARYSLVSRFFLSARNIDWSRTTAYSFGNVGQIYLNRVGREPQGIVEDEGADHLLKELREALAAWRTRDGLPVFDQIFTRGEIYHGEKLKDAPDLLLLPRGLEAMAIGVSEFVSNRLVEPSFAFTGGHRMDGILIAAGDGIAAGRPLEGARIVDLAPTILRILGLQAPQELDGSPIPEICGSHPSTEGVPER